MLRLPFLWLALLFIIALPSCDLFEYHPYSGNLKFKNLTAENVAKIKALESYYADKPSFQFAFISDTQGFFAETEDLVQDINRRNVAFVLHGGDLTNYAFTDEFERMHRALAKLQAPYVTVIGNHDCLGDGAKIYRNMYGPLNHTFTFNQNKFIFLNTNFLELNSDAVPDTNWLEEELESAPENINKIVVSHVPPNDAVANKEKEQAIAELLRQHKVLLALNGHIHRYRAEQTYDDGVWYVSSASADKRGYVMVTVTGDKASFENIDF
ncbi:metallophosphoesterase family protein [Rufibacter roseus]|nr:metallophosphoesterase [Rufibacter roseus]